MSEQPLPPAEAAAAACLGGLDIAKIMSSHGPIVKCVLLRAAPRADAPSSPSQKVSAADLAPRDASSLSVKEMKRELSRHGVDTAAFVEKRELVAALEEARRGAAPLGDKEDKEAKVVTQDDGDDDSANATKEVSLRHLIDEVEVDTTPRKSMVAKTLGGDFTFLGQYEDEGTMVMIRRPDWEAQKDPDAGDIPAENPHRLQPPLHRARVRGDILLMRVAKTEEELDRDGEVTGDGAATGTEEDGSNKSVAVVNAKAEDVKRKEDHDSKKSEGAESGAVAETKAAEEEPLSPANIQVPTNDEFFLDYTREEYLTFAARTDIVAREDTSSSEEESEGEEAEGPRPSSASVLARTDGDDDDDDEDDGDFDPDADLDDDDDDEDNEEHQVGMMNLILGHMLRRFQEERGRGPDSLELLEMRKALADRLGVEVPPVDEEAWEEEEDGAMATPAGKKRVVVAEERNETEEIPRRRTGEEEKEGRSEDDGERDKTNEDGEGVASLKQTGNDLIGDKSECNDQKRRRINDMNGSSCSHDEGENKS